MVLPVLKDKAIPSTAVTLSSKYIMACRKCIYKRCQEKLHQKRYCHLQLGQQTYKVQTLNSSLLFTQSRTNKVNSINNGSSTPSKWETGLVSMTQQHAHFLHQCSFFLLTRLAISEVNNFFKFHRKLSWRCEQIFFNSLSSRIQTMVFKIVATLWSKFEICKTENNTSAPKIQLKKKKKPYYKSMLIHQIAIVVKYLFPFSPNTEQQNFQQTKSLYKL